MASDPVISAMDALQAHIAAGLSAPAEVPAAHSTVVVRTGWPEWNTEASADGILVALTATDPDLVPTTPAALSHAAGVTTWKVADLEWLVQADLWVAYRAHLGPVLEALVGTLDNRAPAAAGLELTQADYHGLSVLFRLVGQRVDQDAESAPRGMWRARLTLRARCSRVRIATTPIIENLDAQTTITGAVSASETTTLVSTS